MEIWQRIPSACNSSSRSSSLLAPIGVGGSRVQVALPRVCRLGWGESRCNGSKQTREYACYPRPNLTKIINKIKSEGEVVW